MTDNVLDFECERAYRLSLARRACGCCYEARDGGGEERYARGRGWRWLCDRCVAEVDALDPGEPDPLGAA